jgi:hypothetical protein
MVNYKDIGIEVSFLISGLFGAILMVSKSAGSNLKSSVVSVLGGMASANYLTPVMIEMLNVKEAKMQNGLAFIVGFLGLKLVEIVSDKFLSKIDQPKPKRNVRKTKR